MNLNNREIYKRCINSEDFAYWVGVAQTDGYFKRQFVKSIKRERFFIVLIVGPKSLPMQNKFIDISQNLFGINGSTYKHINKEGFTSFCYHFGCKNLIDVFDEFEIDFKKVFPPDWVLKNSKLFGSYLAGVIDGDGDIRITRPKYPQCFVRISSQCKLDKLIDNIKIILNCGVNTRQRTLQSKIANRNVIGSVWVTEFKISCKNIDFFRRFVISKIALDHKRNKIREYINLKRVAAEI